MTGLNAGYRGTFSQLECLYGHGYFEVKHDNDLISLKRALKKLTQYWRDHLYKTNSQKVMANFANKSEKVEIFHCKNCIWPKKFGFCFLMVLEQFRKQFWNWYSNWWKNPRGPKGFSYVWQFLSRSTVTVSHLSRGPWLQNPFCAFKPPSTPDTWHLTPGTWHLAPDTWSPRAGCGRAWWICWVSAARKWACPSPPR